MIDAPDAPVVVVVNFVAIDDAAAVVSLLTFLLSPFLAGDYTLLEKLFGQTSNNAERMKLKQEVLDKANIPTNPSLVSVAAGLKELHRNHCDVDIGACGCNDGVATQGGILLVCCVVSCRGVTRRLIKFFFVSFEVRQPVYGWAVFYHTHAGRTFAEFSC